MNKRTLTLLLALSVLAIEIASAATIPAGTTLVVRTNETVPSNAPIGRSFRARLSENVAVRGTVLVRAGAAVTGRVDSRRTRAFTQVVLNVTQLNINGSLIPITTVQGFQATSQQFRTRHGVSVSRGDFFQLPTGTIMRFQLAHPVNVGRR